MNEFTKEELISLRDGLVLLQRRAVTFGLNLTLKLEDLFIKISKMVDDK